MNEQIKVALDNCRTAAAHVKAIGALCTNPHWVTSERRWRIEELSRKAAQRLEDAVAALVITGRD